MKRVTSKKIHIEYEPSDYEVVLSSILFLMTRYARRPDIPVSEAIEEHLHLLAAHVDQDSAFMINTCARLKKQWHVIRANNLKRRELKPADFWPLINNNVN